MTTRDKFSVGFLVPGLALIVAGAAFGSNLSVFIGLFLVAITVRYRKNAAIWEYICFLALLLAVIVGDLLLGLSGPAWGTPFIGAIPLILSYVFDYMDEQRQKLAAPEGTIPVPVVSAEPTASPKGGQAKRSANSVGGDGPPSVS